MNRWEQGLQPPDWTKEGLATGLFEMNVPANRVIRADDRTFVAALIPGDGVQNELAKLSLNPSEAGRLIGASRQLQGIAGLLSAMQITSTVGALASVANVAISCVGFAVVIHRLGRIEGRLDACIGKLEALQQSVAELHTQGEAMSIARLRSAGACLDRSLAAETPQSRRELAGRARDLFQDSKYFCLELWRRARPWDQGAIEVWTALEMQNRFVACAIGEMQAEFILGDLGSFRHAVRSTMEDFQEQMRLDAPSALRARSDAACSQGTPTLATFGGRLATTAAELRVAQATTAWTRARLAAFELDADLPEALGLEPHEIAKAVRSARGMAVYALARKAA